MTPERTHYLRGHRDAEKALTEGNALEVAQVTPRASTSSFTGLYWYGYLHELTGKADWLSS